LSDYPLIFEIHGFLCSQHPTTKVPAVQVPRMGNHAFALEVFRRSSRALTARKIYVPRYAPPSSFSNLLFGAFFHPKRNATYSLSSAFEASFSLSPVFLPGPPVQLISQLLPPKAVFLLTFPYPEDLSAKRTRFTSTPHLEFGDPFFPVLPPLPVITKTSHLLCAELF